MASLDYKAAGVDIAAGNEAVKRIKKNVESTFSPDVLTGLGSFAALYDLKSIINTYENPVLVQSIDGVGTKMMVAKRMQKFDTIGIDLVSATTNDIIVLGAKPLTLLDYIANDKLDPQVIEDIVAGMCVACRDNHISLVGGETAEMPGTYLPGEHDLVGIITGVVEKEKAILGKDIKPGDIILGFPSSGLHTNGYSLARHVLFNIAKLDVDTYVPEFMMTVGEALLTPHINYNNPIQTLLANDITIKGMAHITGGGLLENIPRVLPPDCAVEIKKASIPPLPIFTMLAELSKVDENELYRTFNMGVGLIMIVDPNEVASILSILTSFPHFPCLEIGKVISGNPSVRMIA